MPVKARLTVCPAYPDRSKVFWARQAPTSVRPDTWIRVIGVYNTRVGTDPVNKAKVPYLEVRSWQETTAPKQPYE